jgi:hypothetical protein
VTEWMAVGERVISPFQTLSSTAHYAIEKAESTEEGSRLEVMTAMLLAPMMVEAVLNHVGAELFVTRAGAPEFWKQLEYSRPEDKLKVICEHVRFVPDFSRQPFQRFRTMFKFRNLIAHGRTEVVPGQMPYDPESTSFAAVHRSPEFMPKWERDCTIANAKSYYAAARKIAAVLCEATGVDYPITCASWTGSPISDAESAT